MDQILSESVASSNVSLVFTIALLYAAISGQEFKSSHRVSVVYAYCLIMPMLHVIDYPTAIMGSAAVLFLILEVFTPDKKLVSLFSLPRKVFDFIYRMIFELYGWLYYPILFLQEFIAGDPCLQDFTQAFTLIAVVILTAITSRKRFASKQITDIIEILEENGEDPATCAFSETDLQKIKILVFMEDGQFFNRSETKHIIAVNRVFRKIVERINRTSFRDTLSQIAKVERIKELLRGYGTIEMQILRTIGLEFGSYSLTVRRKFFELFFAQAVFNSYIEQLSPDSPARNNIKNWILKNYINTVPTKIGLTPCKPKDGQSTFSQLFGKEFTDLSLEEFFVWCLGLPHYKNGIGPNAVNIHMDAINHFNLDQNAIEETISKIRSTET